MSKSLSRRSMIALALAAGMTLPTVSAWADTASGDADAVTNAAAPAAREVAFPVTITDDRGVEVTIDGCDAVVSCMGSFSRAWELMGGTLVGATSDSFDNYGVDRGSITDIGYFTTPDLEAILALEPDLVIMSANTNGHSGTAGALDLAESLQAAGIAVVAFDVTVFADYVRMMDAMCQLTGRDDLYAVAVDEVGQRIDGIVALAQEAASQVEAPSFVVMTTYSGGVRVQAPSAAASAIACDLGGSCITAADRGLLKDFSMESLLDIDPDYIFVLAMGDNAEAADRAFREQTESNPAWAGLTAVAEGRMFVLDESLYQYKPLDHWDLAYADMCGYLWPEVDVTPIVGSAE